MKQNPIDLLMGNSYDEKQGRRFYKNADKQKDYDEEYRRNKANGLSSEHADGVAHYKVLTNNYGSKDAHKTDSWDPDGPHSLMAIIINIALIFVMPVFIGFITFHKLLPANMTIKYFIVFPEVFALVCIFGSIKKYSNMLAKLSNILVLPFMTVIVIASLYLNIKHYNIYLLIASLFVNIICVFMCETHNVSEKKKKK
ncbi:hypothetical protein M1B72_02585 [Geomonas paludis]|uniref:Uncharacterized protein n=1 Tax=Geomonas paludis TaxID=2740185 RepID=A0A6V8N0E4_9BACT|nr:hypothetical protein [Geomonas paludis]UPU36610.1 hypothetical protein M1B72_02585 [Geomonas paludis]GFO65871.1 hypothetical protein GMPD_37900 [Geomonas paludis]